MAKQTTETPVTPSPTPTAPAGPTTQELASRLDALQQNVAARENEVSTLKNENAFLRQLQQTYQQPAPQYQQPNISAAPVYAQPNVTIPPFDYSHPEESTSRIVDAKVSQIMAEREARERADFQVREQTLKTQYLNNAQMKFNTGWANAKSKDTELYKGIEPIIEEGVRQAFFMGMIPDTALDQAATYERAAKMIWLEQNRMDKLVRTTPNPVAPTAGLTPQPSGLPTSETTFVPNDSTRDLMKQLGLTEAQAQANAKLGKELYGGK